MKYARPVVVGVCALVVMVAASCGGGGGGSPSPAPPSSNVAVAISPTSATVGFGTTQQFTATVTGTTNTAVNWSLAGGSGGTSQVGTISSSGLYTAPEATSAAVQSSTTTVSVTAGHTASSINVAVPQLNPVNSVTVTATSQADSSKSASTPVTLSGLSILALGQCTQSGTNLNCSGDATGTQISRSQMGGQTVYLFIAGYGIVQGTTYSISGNDIAVTQPSGANFGTTPDGTPAVAFPIVVSPAATLGRRNVVVTNPGGELSAFPGGLQITQ